MCGCVKKGQRKSNIQITSTRVFKDGLVYDLSDELQLSATPEILLNLYNSNIELFELVRIINTPFEIYITSTEDLLDYGYIFYGKYKTNDEIYILKNDFNSSIMERV